MSEIISFLAGMGVVLVFRRIRREDKSLWETDPGYKSDQEWYLTEQGNRRQG